MLTNDNLPALFQAADNASLKAQKAFLRSMRFDLMLISISAIIGAISFDDADTKRILAIIAALFLLISIILTVMVQLNKWEDAWYDGRAVAESVKTLSWRYATCAEPFLIGIPIETVDSKFIESLRALLKDKESIIGSISGSDTQKSVISQEMRKGRFLSFQDRLIQYIAHRITTQQTWYANKSKFNETRQKIWFATIIAAQSFALISSVYVILNPATLLNLTGFFTSLAASGIAWLQLRKHQELTRSYNSTAFELGMVIEQSRYIKTEEELAIFIADAETAISREHTLWLARRDKFSSNLQSNSRSIV